MYLVFLIAKTHQQDIWLIYISKLRDRIGINKVAFVESHKAMLPWLKQGLWGPD